MAVGGHSSMRMSILNQLEKDLIVIFFGVFWVLSELGSPDYIENFKI